jgi:hypothetical protein
LTAMQNYINKGDKIFFLSGDRVNDFLSNYISAKLNAKSYNCGGDKNIKISMKSWPNIIEQMKACYEVNQNAYNAFQNKVLDKLIIPYFDLRWHSYYWPPSEADREKLKEERLSVFNVKDDRFRYKEEKWFGVVELK